MLYVARLPSPEPITIVEVLSQDKTVADIDNLSWNPDIQTAVFPCSLIRKLPKLGCLSQKPVYPPLNFAKRMQMLKTQ